jgi:hypothetical protein
MNHEIMERLKIVKCLSCETTNAPIANDIEANIMIGSAFLNA